MQAPDPSIERTCPSGPSHVLHPKRWASGQQMNRLTIFTAAVFASLLVGCFGNQLREYRGRLSDSPELAKVSALAETAGVSVVSIDDKRVEFLGLAAVPPGRHTIKLRFFAPLPKEQQGKDGVAAEGFATLIVDLKPGHLYMPAHTKTGRLEWEASLIDYVPDFPEQCLPARLLQTLGAYNEGLVAGCRAGN